VNRIVQVKLTLTQAGWLVEVTKEFAPENGGGSEVFREHGGTEIHHALDVARSMVTLTPAQNSGGAQ